MTKYVWTLEVLVVIQVSQALQQPRSHQMSFPSLPEKTMQLSTRHFLIMHCDRFISHPSQSDFCSSQNSSRACFADLKGGRTKSPSEFVQLLSLQPKWLWQSLDFSIKIQLQPGSSQTCQSLSASLSSAISEVSLCSFSWLDWRDGRPRSVPRSS